MKLAKHPGIEINPNVCHGKPVIVGTRLAVSQILGALGGGQTREELLEDYPSLTMKGIVDALSFGSSLSNFEELTMEPIPAS